jgi:hypothetical protein
VARQAAAKHGITHRNDPLAVGMSDKAIALDLTSGALVQLYRGVYRVGGAPETWAGRVLATCMRTRGRTWASHGFALALWGWQVEERGWWRCPRPRICAPGPPVR